MRRTGSLNHSIWECKYHVVFIPKYWRKSIFGRIRSELGEIFKRLAEQKESRIEEGHLMSDHVHMMISIPSKYAVCPSSNKWYSGSEYLVESFVPHCYVTRRAVGSANDTPRNMKMMSKTLA